MIGILALIANTSYIESLILIFLLDNYRSPLIVVEALLSYYLKIGEL
jgi:hypothetical protein